MYQGHNTQDSARFNINYFQRFEIPLTRSDGSAIDRSQGVNFPEPEGFGFYVAAADYPAVLSILVPATGIIQSFELKKGLKVKAPFKGFFITHPPMTGSQFNPPKLALILFKDNPSIELENGAAYPLQTGIPAYRVITNTGTNFSIAIHIPPGTTYIPSIKIALSYATLTSAQWILTDKQGVNVQSVKPTIDGVAYNGANIAIGALSLVAGIPAATVGRLEDSNIVVPTGAYEMRVDIVGTTLSPVGVMGTFL